MFIVSNYIGILGITIHYFRIYLQKTCHISHKYYLFNYITMEEQSYKIFYIFINK